MNKYVICLFLAFISNYGNCCTFRTDFLEEDKKYTEPYDSVAHKIIPIPAPNVDVISITRGHTVKPGEDSCGDIAVAKLKISFPENSKYKISDFGFYVKVVEGEVLDEYAESIPVKLSNVKNNAGEYRITWVEGNPKAFEAKIMLVAISKSLRISNPVYFVLKHAGS